MKFELVDGVMKVLRGSVMTSRRDLVFRVLAPGYVAEVAQRVTGALEQFSERLSAGKRDLSIPGEKVEEALLFRHQVPKKVSRWISSYMRFTAV
jgi:hypothetical protein